MKTSKYTSLVTLTNDLKLAYNARSDKFVAIKGNVRNIDIQNLPSLKEREPSTYGRLIEAGCIIDEDADEVAELGNQIVRIDNDDTFFDLHINPTLDCNFRCWYCYESHKEGSCMSDSTINQVIRFAKSKIEKITKLKHFTISFFGGEPLLKFDIIRKLITPISQFCSHRSIEFKVGFTSNGFLITDEIVEFLKDFDASFQITLDGGRADHNKTRFAKGGIGSFDQILTNVSLLLKKEIRVILRINYTPDNLGNIDDVIDYLKSLPEQSKQSLSVDFQRVWQTKTQGIDETYMKAKELRQRVRALGLPVLNNRLINGVRNSCYADRRNQILINYNGDVFKCTAKDFSKENRLGFLKDGEITEDRPGLIEEWMNSRFKNPVCYDCRIAPLCGGGCRRHAVINKGAQTCIFGYTQDAIDELILERFEEYFLNQ